MFLEMPMGAVSVFLATQGLGNKLRRVSCQYVGGSEIKEVFGCQEAALPKENCPGRRVAND
jgi:hypothetical protein